MKEHIEREAVLNLLEKINPVDFGSIFNYESHNAVGECLRKISYDIEKNPRLRRCPCTAWEMDF